MEREISSAAGGEPDAVKDTLERLEVADTLEELRHHIDELITQLSEKEQAATGARHELSPELEGQLESLGNKVESASDLLAELTDLLEAQTERIETIEQQLGDPDLYPQYPEEPRPRYAEEKTPPSREPEGVPTFAMRPPKGEREAVRAAIPERRAPEVRYEERYEPQVDPTIALREYLDIRLERLEAGISQIERRVSEIRGVAEERERLVRELEERLLILVDAGVSGSTGSAPASEAHGVASARHAPAETASREQPRRNAGRPRPLASTRRRAAEYDPREIDDAGEREQSQRAQGSVRRTMERRVRARTQEAPKPRVAPRPRQMPLRTYQAAVEELKSSRNAPGRDPQPEDGEVRPCTRREARHGRDATRSAGLEGMHEVVSFQPAMPHLPLRVAQPASNGVAVEASAMHAPCNGEAHTHEPRNGSLDAHAMHEPHNGSVAAPPDIETTRNGNGVADPMHELERLVERDIRLRHDFRNGVRPGKAHPVVLVVDDAPDALKLLSIYLSRTGYQVVTASSAEDCLAKLRHHQVDAVVLDAKMPGASGAHVCRVLHQDPAYASRRDVPVIVYTGYPDEFSSDVRSAWGAAEYVVKGGDMLPLITALVRHTTSAERQ